MPVPSPARMSTRSHRFDEVPAPRVQRSSFDLSRKRKTTFNAGYLVPLICFEVLPGDTFSVQGEYFGRLQTLDFPLLDNMYFDTMWFYCNNRILWENWGRFLGAQDSPSSSIDYTIPVLEGNEPGATFQFSVHSLGDYFGLPIDENLGPSALPGDVDEDINALPFRMYNLVHHEWFRAQELQNGTAPNIGDGPDDVTDYVLLKRGKRHDYITSCLIAPQRGEGVSLPIGTSAPVIGNDTTVGWIDQIAGTGYGMYAPTTSEAIRLRTDLYGDPVGTAIGGGTNAGDNRSVGLTTDPTKSGMIADLSEAVAASINDMREAIAIQQMLERDARFGTRYVERIFAQFGVVVPDYTAQRPEYLGGSIDRVGVMSVPQMTASPVTPTMSDAKGALAAYAQIQARSGFTRSFVEHGYVMCLGSLRADISYQQRIDKMWSRQTRYDFYDPLMAHLGEQAVLDKEVWYDTAGTPNGVWGYQERWAEYRMGLDEITGKFRSAAAGTLDSWHLGLHFTSQPDLNATFIQDSPPIDRVLAIDTATQPNCLMDMAFKIRGARPIPVYSVPGLERL